LYRELPPVLNLQLNRFQFDMQYNRKKKLNSALYFPDVLDMAEYLDDKTKVFINPDLVSVDLSPSIQEALFLFSFYLIRELVYSVVDPESDPE
jgi:hypothetical protein